MKRAYVDTPGGQIHYRTEGSGEPLLLLHRVYLSSEEFLPVMPILGKSYRVFAMDFPGYGMSDKPPKEYSIADYAQIIINFMDALNISKASMVGDGAGSTMVEAAIIHPGRVDKLVISGCPAYTPEARESRLKDPRFGPMEMKEDGSHIMKAWGVQKTYNPKSTPEMWHRAVVNYLLAGENAENIHYAIWRHALEERLPLLKHPALLISGPDDVFYKDIEITKSRISRSKIHIMEGGGIGGLYITYDRPEEFSQVILDFLKEPGV